MTTAEVVGQNAPVPEDAKDESQGLFKRITTNLRQGNLGVVPICLLYTSPSPRD